MKNLLYLVHRLPYPPNKGDKITSYNMLKYLSRHFNIYLGCFIDEPDDWQHLDKVKALSAEVCAVPLRPRLARLAAIRGLLNGEPLSLPYYRSQKLRDWVNRILGEHRMDGILVISGAMAQYVSSSLGSVARTVLDLEDVDSDKWRLFARDHGWPMNRILMRESRKLLGFERAMAGKFDVTLFVSRDEARMFQHLAPEVAEQVRYRIQGVDSDYFDPELSYPDPYGGRHQVLVFTGAMDYWPNTDAAVWFATQVMPSIRMQVEEAHFCIVGRNPPLQIRSLASLPYVTVTGTVPDVRPYLAHATCAALPLRIARGIQNKVLEAMAMEKPILATPQAIHGLHLCPGVTPFIGDTADQLAEKATELLKHAAYRQAESRRCVIRHYNWEENMNMVLRLLKNLDAEAGDEIGHGKAEKNRDAHSSHR